MRSTRIAARILLAAALFAIAFVLLPRAVKAQCDPATGACGSPGGGNDKVKRSKTPTPLSLLFGPAPKSVGGGSGDPVPPSVFTAIAGTTTAETLTAAAPPPPDRPIVTPVAGPVFLLPGTTVMIIIVGLVALVLVGLLVIPRL